MAVIQDLPPEILHRILELMIQDERFWAARCEARASLTSAALVARSWRAPAQALLSSCLEFSSRSGTWQRYLHILQASPDSASKHVRRLELEVWNDRSANDQLALLQRHQVDLQELRLYSYNLKLEPRRVYYLAGISRLEICTTIETDPSFRLPISMTMETLQIGPGALELPSFLLPLSAVAPRLTKLELDCTYRALPDAHEAPLSNLALAPQLAQLTVKFPFERIPELRARVLSTLDTFLPACTSITTLSLHRTTYIELNRILLQLSAPLTLLETFEILGLDQKGERLPRELAETFQLPCLAQLKRWRFTRAYRDAGTAAVGAMYGRAGEQWRAACRARD